MNFQDYLRISALEIDHALEVFFSEWSKEIERVNPKLRSIVGHLIEGCRGGKRLRGVLVKLGYDLAGGSVNQDIIKPAISFEIFQTAILAHDDIIDQSPLRRGKPTIYKALGGDHYAISQTICLGDIGFFVAQELITQSTFPDQNIKKAVQSFSRTMRETALGEILDVELPTSPDQIFENDAVDIFKLKTSRYTITGPLHLGAILAGASDEMLESMAKFGENLGIAFQIQDDILGVFGDETTIGKSVTSDIEEGKITFLYIEALKRSTQEQKEILKRFYGKGDVGEEGLEKIRKVFIETGALEYSKQKAIEYVNIAKRSISEITSDPQKAQLLNEMAEFLVERNK